MRVTIQAREGIETCPVWSPACPSIVTTQAREGIETVLGDSIEFMNLTSSACPRQKCNTRIVCQLERAYIFSALEKKEQSMSCQQKKRDKRNIGSRMASYCATCKVSIWIVRNHYYIRLWYSYRIMSSKWWKMWSSGTTWETRKPYSRYCKGKTCKVNKCELL